MAITASLRAPVSPGDFSISIQSVSSDEDSDASSSDDEFILKRPALKHPPRRSLVRDESMESKETNATMRTSNSNNQLKKLKKRMSLKMRRSDSYRKIKKFGSRDEEERRNLDSTSGSLKNSLSKSDRLPPRPSVRRRRSFGDGFRSLYKLATADKEREDDDYHRSNESTDESRFYRGNNANSLSRLSSPDIRDGRGTGSYSTSSTGSSSKSASNDLLTRAATLAAQKQQQKHTMPNAYALANNEDLFAKTLAPKERLSAPQPASATRSRRSSDPGIDFAAFQRINRESQAPRRSSEIKTSGSRRGSRRMVPLETMEEERRKDRFMKDFPGEPVPSDAILVRLYGNTKSHPPPPPPPPLGDHMTEQDDADKHYQRTPLGKGLRNLNVSSPVIDKDDFLKPGDEYSYMTFPSADDEWNEWKLSARKLNPNDDCSQHSKDTKSSRRSSSNKRSIKASSNHSSDPNDRSAPRSHAVRRGSNHKPRPKSKSDHLSSSGREIRRRDLSPSTSHEKSNESKASRSKNGRRHSSHHTPVSSPKGTPKGTPRGTPKSTPKSKARKRVETMKPKTPKSKRDTTERTALLTASDHDHFQNALLDLSNGSFFDAYDNGSNHMSCSSFDFVKTSVSNSIGSFCESEKSFADDVDRPEKDLRKKRRGKRDGSSVCSERRRKPRSRSADESSKTRSKSRRGRRDSKSKLDMHDDRNQLSFSKLEGLESIQKPSSDRSSIMKPSSDRSSIMKPSSDRSSIKKPSSDRSSNQRKSPRNALRKTLGNESGAKQEHKDLKSPKFTASTKPIGSPRTPTGKSYTKSSSLKSIASLPLVSKEADPMLDYGHQSMDFTPLIPKYRASKVVAKDEKHADKNNFYDLALKSWGNEPLKTPHEDPTDAPSTPRRDAPRRKDSTRKTRWNPPKSPLTNAASPRCARRTIGSATSAEDSPISKNRNKIGQKVSEFKYPEPAIPDSKTCDKIGQKVKEFKYPDTAIPAVTKVEETNPSPDTEEAPTSPSKSESSTSTKVLDFPLNFVEYKDVSPLTVASKKIDPHVLTAMNYLQL